MSHTPGPWKTGPINYADVYSDSTGDLVALIPKGFDSTIANARLIAAAPELLEALKEAAVWYGGENHSYECRSNGNADLCDCGVKSMDDRINRAIAKAEGR